RFHGRFHDRSHERPPASGSRANTPQPATRSQTMTTSTEATSTSKPKREKQPLNGVDVPTLFATINAVKGQRELAAFTFRASNRWLRGTHSRSRSETFSGAGGEHVHLRSYEYDSDHPAVLCGADQGPTPVEYLLGALAGCLTA